MIPENWPQAAILFGKARLDFLDLARAFLGAEAGDAAVAVGVGAVGAGGGVGVGANEDRYRQK